MRFRSVILFGICLVLSLLILSSPSLCSQPLGDGGELVLDDFQSGNGTSVFGTDWSGFSDQVMGGLSELRLQYAQADNDRLTMRLSGRVRLENNGGFIQARLPLERARRRFDASEFSGVRVVARAEPGAYYVFLRTRNTWLPWQYYGGRINIQQGDEWHTYDIPFEAFQAESTRRALDTSQLKSIAIVAYGEAFSADIEVARLSFYR